jgi:transcriptional regulator with XRE-family HTH domain
LSIITIIDNYIFLNVDYYKTIQVCSQGVLMGSRGERVSNIVKLARGGMSQRAFGIELGVSATAVQHWENGVSIPETKHLSGIATRAGYTLQQVIDFIEGGDLPEADVIVMMTRQIKKLSLKQIALIDRAVSDRLSAIAENTGR